MEREGYYYSLESQPLLLAHSSTAAWVLSSGPYNHPEPKELKNIGNHKVVDKWDNSVATEVINILEVNSIQWTSVKVF